MAARFRLVKYYFIYPDRSLFSPPKNSPVQDFLDALGTALMAPDGDDVAEMLWSKLGWEPHVREKHDYSPWDESLSFLTSLPSGYVKIAIENGHRNSEFSH